jgi:hypothetical protein
VAGTCGQRSMLAASWFAWQTIALCGRNWHRGFAGWCRAWQNQVDTQFLCLLPGRVGQCHPWTNFQLPNAAGCEVLDITYRVECPHD